MAGIQPKTLLTIDGEVIFYWCLFDREQSDRLFQELTTQIAWRQETATIFGKKIPLPRLTAWYGDPGKCYTYSGITMHPQDWIPPLLEIKSRIDTLAKVNFNSVLLNLYQDGKAGMGWHSDAEPELGKNPIIGSVSLGATRRFVLKHKYRQDLDRVVVDLPHGSFLLMQGATQHYWQHQVPKTKSGVGPRINLTFRVIRAAVADKTQKRL